MPHEEPEAEVADGLGTFEPASMGRRSNKANGIPASGGGEGEETRTRYRDCGRRRHSGRDRNGLGDVRLPSRCAGGRNGEIRIAESRLARQWGTAGVDITRW